MTVQSESYSATALPVAALVAATLGALTALASVGMAGVDDRTGAVVDDLHHNLLTCL